jgi:hypothetical protein
MCVSYVFSFPSFCHSLVHVRANLESLNVQDGSAVVSIMGHIILAGMSKLGEGKSHFSEIFILGPAQSGTYPYYIANQVFRLMK